MPSTFIKVLLAFTSLSPALLLLYSQRMIDNRAQLLGKGHSKVAANSLFASPKGHLLNSICPMLNAGRDHRFKARLVGFIKNNIL